MQDEENKKKRGRPKKKTVQENTATEKEQRLEMTANTRVPTMDSVQRDLSLLYSTCLGQRTGAGWTGSMNDLQKYNPFLQNKRLQMINSTPPGELDRESLINALSNPGDSEDALKAQAMSASSSQYLYYKILRMSADIPEFKYYKVPEYMDAEDYKSKDFKDEDAFTDDWLRTFDLQNTLARMSLEVKREGKPTYLLRTCITEKEGKKKTSYATFQKLPSKYVKLIGIGEKGYIASFNMMVFLNPAVLPEMYPDFIQDVWNDMVHKGCVTKKGDERTSEYSIDPKKLVGYSYTYDNGSFCEAVSGSFEINTTGMAEKAYAFWVPMPQDFCYTFCSDSSTAWNVPDTSGMLLSIKELSDFDTLQGLVESTPLVALLTAEASFINNTNAGQNQTELNPETIAAFQDKFNMATSTNIEAFFAPLKNFKLLTMPSQPNSSEISANATKNVVVRAGLGGLLTTTDKPSVKQVQTAQLLAEAECQFVTNQFESVLNMIVNKLIGCKYEWKIKIWGGIFTMTEDKRAMKELFISGGSFILPKLLSAYDLTLRDSRAIQHYIESLDIYDDLKTITQGQQEALKEIEDGADSGAGRTSINEDEIDNDNTAASIGGGLNGTDSRVYARKAMENGRCAICHCESDYWICEECMDELGVELREDGITKIDEMNEDNGE